MHEMNKTSLQNLPKKSLVMLMAGRNVHDIRRILGRDGLQEIARNLDISERTLYCHLKKWPELTGFNLEIFCNFMTKISEIASYHESVLQILKTASNGN